MRIRILESDAVDAPTERSPTNPKQDIQAQKRYLRMMAKNRLEDSDGTKAKLIREHGLLAGELGPREREFLVFP